MLLIVAALVAAGCGGQDRAALEADVEDFRLVREADGRQVVVGVFVNPSASRPIASATVEVELYDQPVEAGVEPGETIRFEVRDVVPGGRKPFRETVDTRLTLSGARVGQILVF